MAGWKKFEISLPALPVEPFTEIIEKIKAFIEVLVNILEIILSIVAALLDPIATAIKAIIEAIKAAIESFLEDLGGYLLYVPIRKRFMTNFLGLGDITPDWLTDSGIMEESGATLPTTNPDMALFAANMNRYNGGNVGFFRTVMESVFDEGDTSRPQFTNSDDYVGGLVILMGTNFDPLGFLDDIWKLFGLFNLPDSTPKVPRPKNLKGRAITRVAGGTFSVLLNWDPVEVPLVSLQDLGGTFYYPSRYAIIRVKNDTRALAASSVVDLMGKRTLSVGDKFNNGNATVIAEGKLNVSNTSYIDKDVSASSSDAFYYAVAWQLDAYNKDDSLADPATPLDYWYISNVVRVVPYPVLPTATPPNWIRTPSIASIFPPFADLLRRFVMELENFADKILGITDLLLQYVDFLKKEIARYEALINYILDEIAKLKFLFTMPTAGIYMRTFKGRGGNLFFLTDLATSLLPSDPNAPPFNAGDEYVTGVVLMTGGYAPQVDAFVSALELFFGGGGDGGLSDLVGQLGEQVDSLEETIFGPDMQPTDAAPNVVAFDSRMCPLKTCCNPPAAPAVTTFGANLLPV